MESFKLRNLGELIRQFTSQHKMFGRKSGKRMDGEKLFERRKHERFPAPPNTYVQLNDQVSKLGRVLDISKGGLAFRYISVGEELKQVFQLDLISAQVKPGVNPLPVKVVSEIEMESETPARAVALCRAGVQFQELLDEQVDWLESFTQKCGQTVSQ
jgi:hypothetical protein